MECILRWIFERFLVNFGSQDGVVNLSKIEKIEIETELNFNCFWKASWITFFVGQEAAKTRRDQIWGESGATLQKFFFGGSQDS